MHAQDTPNPLAKKFDLGLPPVDQGYYLYSSFNEVQGMDVLEDLFSVPGIDTVLLAPNFITITRKEEVSWDLLDGVLFSLLEYHLPSFPLTPVVPAAKESFEGWEPATEQEKEICQRLEVLLDTQVRPAIEEDGGMIELVAFKDHVVYVRLQGACAQCPHSQETLKQGIERTLCYYEPEVERVEAIV